MKREAKIVLFFAAVLFSATSCGTSSGPTGNNTATPADPLTGSPSAAFLVFIITRDDGEVYAP